MIAEDQSQAVQGGVDVASSSGGLAAALAAIVAAADPVEDAAQQASLLLLAFPTASPAEIAAQVRRSGLSPPQAAQVLMYGPPCSVFPNITEQEMKDALEVGQADLPPDVADLFPRPGEPLLIRFTGGTQVRVPSLDAYNFGPGQDFTVEGWIRAPQVDLRGDCPIIHKPSSGGYPFSLRISPGGYLVAARSDGSTIPFIQSSTPFTAGRFHHVAFTSAQGQLTLYVDGQAQGATPDSTSGTTANDGPLLVGGQRAPARSVGSFTGRILEVRLWNRARTQAQLVQAMRRTVDPGTPGLVGYFKLREGTGATAVDSTAAQNSGVIANPGWSRVDGYPLVETRSVPPVGGSGAPFDDTVAATALGRPLSMVRVRSGDIVDAVQTFYGSGDSRLESHGGTEGGCNDVVLDAGDAVTGVSGHWGLYYGGVYILQLTLSTRAGKTYGQFGGTVGATWSTPFSFQAAPGESLLAFTGTVAMGNNGTARYIGSLGVTFQTVYD